MRILMLSQFYPPIVGGQERHVRTLSVGLVRLGHDVDLLTTATIPGDVGIESDEGVRVHRVRTSAQRLPLLYSDPQRPHAMPVPDPRVASEIRSLIERADYDVVHAHDWTVNSALGPTRTAGVPLVYTLHDYSHVCATKRLMRNGSVCGGPALGRCATCAGRHHGPVVGPAVVAANLRARRARQRTVTRFVAVSSAVARSTGLEDGTYEVIPNFIADELVGDDPRARSKGPVVFAGDLTRDKGVEVLLEAHRRMSPGPPMVLAGRQFADLQLRPPPNVRMAGVLAYDEVIQLMRSASVVVVPSIVADCCPTVVLEAMAAGRPVVASASGGIVDLVAEGTTGRLVAPGDPDALADAIMSVLADPDLAERMGIAALERVRMFTASSVLGRVEDLYRSVVEGEGRYCDA